MAYKNGNYSAFYVSEPFSESNLGASATKDFVSYNLLRDGKAMIVLFLLMTRIIKITMLGTEAIGRKH